MHYFLVSNSTVSQKPRIEGLFFSKTAFNEGYDFLRLLHQLAFLEIARIMLKLWLF